jgi:hypothetical protein
MPRLKGDLTFRQFLANKDYKTYRSFRYDKVFSIQDMLNWVDEWEQEKLSKRTQTKN